MTTAAATRPRAFAVLFKELDRWDTTFFRGINWAWPKEFFVSIGSLLEAKSISVDPKLHDSEKPIIDKITFGGYIFVTDPDARSNYKGRLFWANTGDFIYSKIRVKQGSCAIVPPSIPAIAVSPEYPVYRILADKVLPEYFALLVRCQPFLKILDGLSHGGSTKTRIHPRQFESISIPIPPVPIQQAIIDRWQQAQMEIDAAKESIVSLEKQIQSFIHNRLGITNNLFRERPKAFALQWDKVDRWGVDMCWRALNKPAESTFPKTRIKDLCRMGSGGTPSRSKPVYYVDGEIPWVKTTEVKNNVITSTEEKITSFALKNSSAKLYPSGSLIVAMYGQGVTRGRTAKLAIEAATNQACCVLYDFVPNIDPDFLWFFLMGEYENLRSLASGNNQPNLNAEMIANYEVPLPPLEFQKDLVKEVQMRRATIKNTKDAVAFQIDEIKSDIEAMILGTKKSD